MAAQLMATKGPDDRGPSAWIARASHSSPTPVHSSSAVSASTLVEATTMPGKGTLILTGHLGDIMKESARAALLESRLERTTVRAPVAGILDDRYVDAGEIVNTGTADSDETF